MVMSGSELDKLETVVKGGSTLDKLESKVKESKSEKMGTALWYAAGSSSEFFDRVRNVNYDHLINDRIVMAVEQLMTPPGDPIEYGTYIYDAMNSDDKKAWEKMVEVSNIMEW